jgi:hypothetical protein
MFLLSHELRKRKETTDEKKKKKFDLIDDQRLAIIPLSLLAGACECVPIELLFNRQNK